MPLRGYWGGPEPSWGGQPRECIIQLEECAPLNDLSNSFIHSFRLPFNGSSAYSVTKTKRLATNMITISTLFSILLPFASLTENRRIGSLWLTGSVPTKKSWISLQS